MTWSIIVTFDFILTASKIAFSLIDEWIRIFPQACVSLATANTRRLSSVLECRGGLIPFRDGERRLVRLNSGTPIPLTFDLMLL